MIRNIKRAIAIIRWLWYGCVMIHYDGYFCGACGRYWKIPFCVPTFDSLGRWWDTWGVCPKGKGCGDETKSLEERFSTRGG